MYCTSTQYNTQFLLVRNALLVTADSNNPFGMAKAQVMYSEYATVDGTNASSPIPRIPLQYLDEHDVPERSKYDLFYSILVIIKESTLG